jgi:CMP-N-acetylneuraminic acid synthetase
MIDSRKVAALVPIKTHSERVKEKNFREFCGKPLYHHVLTALERTAAVDIIIVNTDSDRIAAEVQKLFGKGIVHIRPERLRGDFVSTNTIFAYDIEQSHADIYLQTHATNPLIKPETFARALKTFVEGEDDHDSLFSVNAYQSRFYDSELKPINHDPNNLIRTQDLPPVYEENSCIYVFTPESFRKTQARIGTHPILFPTPLIESIDIDDLISWRIAELLGLHTLTSNWPGNAAGPV